MPTPVLVENGTTVAGQWTLLFASGPESFHNGVNVRNKRGNGEDILIAIVARGTSAPPNGEDPMNHEGYSVGPGDTYPLSDFADYRNDVYVRGADDGEVDYRAWRVKGKMK